MIFPNKKIFILINQFNNTLTPLFEMKKAFFGYEPIPNIKFRKNENEYVKLLMRLTAIFDELEQFGPLEIDDLVDSAFQQAFPNIMHMFYEKSDVLKSCPLDDDGTKDMKNISYTDDNLYELAERLWNLGVFPAEF